MSYEKDQFGGGPGGGEGSVSVSNMIITALAPYVTSGSLATTLGGYVTSASLNTALGAYVTSTSLATALGAYLSSSSFATAIGAYVTSSSLVTALGGYVTSNSLSAAVVTNTLTVNGTASFSGTVVMTTALRVGGTASFSATVVAELDLRVGRSLFVSATASVGALNIAGVAFTPGSYLTSSSFGTAIAPYLTSASFVTAIAPYLTSASFVTAIGPYLTSNSASIALATKQPNFSVADEGVTLTTVAGTVTTINFVGTGISASLTGGLLTVTASGGTGSGEGSVSVSNMILTALAPYITSASVATALGAYVTSTSLATALGTYLSSSSFATAIAPYITSNSASIALAAKQPNFSVADEGVTLTTVAGTVTTINFVGTGISASLTGGLLTVTAVAGAGSGEGSVSVSTMITTALGGGYLNTASFAAVTVAGRAVGAVLLGYQTLTNVNNFSFSGSWSDFCVLTCQALYRIETGTSVTASAAIYTDGGTTPFLNLATASNTQSAGLVIAVDMNIYGGDGRPNKLLRLNATTGGNLQRVAATATANTGFVNAIKYFSSATITAGMAVLYGWRKA